MLMTVIALIILFDQPETRICLVLAVVVTAVAIVAIVLARRPGPADTAT
jgi:hypothetical protein